MTLRYIFKREITRQFLMFCLVGAECTILNYFVFLVLLGTFSINYLFSAGAGFIAGVLFGFIFNKVISFRSKKSSSKTLPRYFLVYLISLILNLGLLKVLVEVLRFGPIVSNLVIAPLIVLLNFLGTKLVAFGNKEW